MESAYFNHFTIEMSKEQAVSASHQGQCDDDVAYLVLNPTIQEQLASIPDDDLAAELSEYGAWDEKELLDRMENDQRIIWIAAGNINDEKE